MSTPLVLLIGLTVAFVLWAIPTWWRWYDRLHIDIVPTPNDHWRPYGEDRPDLSHHVSVRLRHRGQTLEYERVDLSADDHEDRLAEALAKMQAKRSVVAATRKAAAR